MPPSNPRTYGGTSLDTTVSIDRFFALFCDQASNRMLGLLADVGHPMREDKSSCKYSSLYHDRKNKSLAYWIVLFSLQWLGVLLFWVTAGQGPAVLAAGVGWEGCLRCFSLVYPVLLFLLPFSEDTAWPDYYWDRPR